MSVATTLSATRYVIEVVNTLNIKWNVTTTLDECQVTTRVMYFWQIYNLALIN